MTEYLGGTIVQQQQLVEPLGGLMRRQSVVMAKVSPANVAEIGEAGTCSWKAEPYHRYRSGRLYHGLDAIVKCRQWAQLSGIRRVNDMMMG